MIELSAIERALSSNAFSAHRDAKNNRKSKKQTFFEEKQSDDLYSSKILYNFDQTQNCFNLIIHTVVDLHVVRA